jgi:pepF/M3 family oligoendopeptidase
LNERLMEDGMATTTAELPRWDLQSVFPGVRSPELDAAVAEVVADIETLGARFDALGIDGDGHPSADEAAAAFDEMVERLNTIIDRFSTIASYVTCLVTADSRDGEAQARQSELRLQGVTLEKLSIRLTAWIGTLDVEALVGRSEAAKAHEFTLRRAQVEATHLMGAAEEDLAAELGPSGGGAWNKLYGTVTSQIAVPFERDGTVEELPITAIRNMAYDPDPEVRRLGYEAELDAWQRWSVPLAAAMNSIKGEVNTLALRRGWASALEESLFSTTLDRETLDNMLAAARESFPDLRRYLRAKARALGQETLPFHDLFAPLSAGEGGREWTYDEASRFIVEQFATYSDALRDLAARAFGESWIDAGPRAGKVGGAFCIHIRDGASRVLANYNPSYDAVSTLAHELGHAYHNLRRAPRTPLQRRTPMTLAETASTFCETLVRDAALRDASPGEQVEILEAWLQGCTQIVVDISSRFLFEQAVLDRRQARELAVDELDELMLDAQRETYGDGLDPGRLHPKMWAAKPHYYSADRSYYNYPYLFGLLFALGLYARYREEPDSFRGGYDDLLSSTGMADAATLARRFGIDLRSIDFWRSSLQVIREDVDRFEQLIS